MALLSYIDLMSSQLCAVVVTSKRETLDFIERFFDVLCSIQPVSTVFLKDEGAVYSSSKQSSGVKPPSKDSGGPGTPSSHSRENSRDHYGNAHGHGARDRDDTSQYGPPSARSDTSQFGGDRDRYGNGGKSGGSISMSHDRYGRDHGRKLTGGSTTTGSVVGGPTSPGGKSSSGVQYPHLLFAHPTALAHQLREDPNFLHIGNKSAGAGGGN